MLASWTLNHSPLTKPSDYTALSGMRYERKFMVTAMSLRAIESRIKLHPSYFREAYSQRYINNIYFDTQTLKYYHENERGVSNREKVRIRWYGDTFGAIQNPKLEIKIIKLNLVNGS